MPCFSYILQTKSDNIEKYIFDLVTPVFLFVLSISTFFFKIQPKWGVGIGSEMGYPHRGI